MNTEIISVFFASILAGLFTSALTWVVATKRLPVSHRIAIIGFPRAGKTSLIAALFEYYFRRGARGKAIVPRGEETIQRINENISRLQTQKEVLPTKDQDVFAYRAEVLSKRRYKLEIGDFPGEDTVEFAEKYDQWLHSAPYFKWAVSADAFIFVVDSDVLNDEFSEIAVARQKSAFRAAWQRLREHHLDGSEDLSEKPLFLVFTKTDLLFDDGQLGHFHGGLRAMEPGIFGDVESYLNYRFSDLIEYFGRESKNFRVILTSVIAGSDGERLGVPSLATFILPRGRALIDILRWFFRRN